MNNNMKDLYEFLLSKNEWTTAAELSAVFNVSTRTIRNYISKINIIHKDLISSSQFGYTIIDKQIPLSHDNQDTNRPKQIIGKLLSNHEYNYFNLCDQMFISESTLDADLKKANEILNNFNLSIVRFRSILKIDGHEIQKRKLINHLIYQDNLLQMAHLTDTNYLTDIFDVSKIKDILLSIFDSFHIVVNDYGFNNILVHLSVIIDRIQNEMTITEVVDLDKLDFSVDYDIATLVKESLEKEYSITFSDSELYYLTLTISSNINSLSASVIIKDNIELYIEPQYIEKSKSAIRNLEKTYYLEPFDDDFFIKFTLHVRNLFQRIDNKITSRNPLKAQIKSSYPLIYDMAVFVLGELVSDRMIGDNLSFEDEIAYIAFHLGSYMENGKITTTQLRVCFIQAQYHDMQHNSISKIQKQFNDELQISHIISINEIHLIPDNIDIIISTHSLPIKREYIKVSLFITQSDLQNIQKSIDSIKKANSRVELKNQLNRFIGEQLFKREVYDTPTNIIRNLSNECYELDLCSIDFANDVIARESLSSTSYANHVAVPHSLKSDTYSSFLSIIVNHEPMTWGENDVNIIVLIGTSKNDRSSFKDIFDTLIAVLYTPTNVRKLIQCKDYDTFIDLLTEMILEHDSDS